MDPELPFDSLKEWLKTRWMETYDQVLIQHGYTEISDILECSPDDILSIIKLFKKKGHRLKMRLMIEDLRENYGPYKTQKSSKAFDRQFETTITNDNLEIAPKDDPASVESAGFFSAKKVEVNNTKDVSVSVPEIKFKKENYLTNTQNNVEITEHIEDGSAFKFTDSKVHSDEIKSSIDEEMKDGRISTAYSESPELPEFDVDEELLEIRRSVSTAPKLEKSSSEDEKDMIEEMISEDFVTPEDQNVNSLPEAEEVKSNATGVDLHKNEENLKKLPPVIKPKPNFNKEMGLNPGPIVDKRASLAGIKSEQQGQPAHNSTIRAMQQKLFMEQDKVSKSVNSSDRPITVNKIDMKKFNLPLPQTLGKKKLSPKGVEKTTPEENAPEIVSSSPFIDTQANLKKEDIFATMSNFPGLYGAGLQTMTIGNRPALKKKPFISSSHLKDSPSKAEKPKSAHMVHRYTATEQDMAILKSFRKQDLEEDAVISGNIQITRSKADRTLITKKPYWIIIHDFSIFWFNNNKVRFFHFMYICCENVLTFFL